MDSKNCDFLFMKRDIDAALKEISLQVPKGEAELAVNAQTSSTSSNSVAKSIDSVQSTQDDTSSSSNTDGNSAELKKHDLAPMVKVSLTRLEDAAADQANFRRSQRTKKSQKKGAK